MPVHRLIIAFSLLLLHSNLLLAAAENVVLKDGTAVKVLFFEPVSAVEPPPLALLIAGGSSNEFMARAQFWFGKEFVGRGWAIAVPISPNGKPFSSDNGSLFPELIELLRQSHELGDNAPLLVGISSGGTAALAIAAQSPGTYLGVVATPGRLAAGTDIGNLDGLPIYLRIGEKENFQWNRGLDAMVSILDNAGATVDAATMGDAKHIFKLDWGNLGAWLQDLLVETSGDKSSPLAIP